MVPKRLKPMTSSTLAAMTKYIGGTPFFDAAAEIAEDIGADAMKGMHRMPAPRGDVPWTT